METNDPLAKKRSGSLFSTLICGGKEAAAAGGESSGTAVEEGRKTDGNAKVKASPNVAPVISRLFRSIRQNQVISVVCNRTPRGCRIRRVATREKTRTGR